AVGAPRSWPVRELSRDKGSEAGSGDSGVLGGGQGGAGGGARAFRGGGPGRAEGRGRRDPAALRSGLWGCFGLFLGADFGRLRTPSPGHSPAPARCTPRTPCSAPRGFVPPLKVANVCKASREARELHPLGPAAASPPSPGPSRPSRPAAPLPLPPSNTKNKPPCPQHRPVPPRQPRQRQKGRERPQPPTPALQAWPGQRLAPHGRRFPARPDRRALPRSRRLADTAGSGTTAPPPLLTPKGLKDSRSADWQKYTPCKTHVAFRNSASQRISLSRRRQQQQQQQQQQRQQRSLGSPDRGWESTHNKPRALTRPQNTPQETNLESPLSHPPVQAQALGFQGKAREAQRAAAPQPQHGLPRAPPAGNRPSQPLLCSTAGGGMTFGTPPWPLQSNAGIGAKSCPAPGHCRQFRPSSSSSSSCSASCSPLNWNRTVRNKPRAQSAPSSKAWARQRPGPA
ncbi:formin-like protein 3, partial [Pipra filicauda]|uniref:Formin-like protein 3 n=1 Tax=Pipra filicauda TaxID=649802 RepID=A0A7R5KDZ2_9PASS